MQPIKRGDYVQVAAKVQFEGLGGKIVRVENIGELRGMFDVIDDQTGTKAELDERVLTKVER